jgi:hypothetical protein
MCPGRDLCSDAVEKPLALVSLAVVNRYDVEAAVEIVFDPAPRLRPFRKYEWSVRAIPSHPFGDLQPPSRGVALEAGRARDVLAPLSVTVYTTAYDVSPPGKVRGVRVGDVEGGARRITWTPNAEPDVCYYRVYRRAAPGAPRSEEKQIGSTVATEFVDGRAPDTDSGYRVVAVDFSGNASE